MDSKLITEYWDSEDPRPLVEIIVQQMGNRKMRSIEPFYGKLYSIEDWLESLLKPQEPINQIWLKLRLKLISENAFEGKIFVHKYDEVDFCDENGLFYLTSHLPNMPVVVKVKKFLADAGVVVDKIRQDPALGVDAAWEAYRAQGKDDDWIQIRLLGKIKREEFTKALDKATRDTLSGRDYAVASDDVYIGLWQRTCQMLLKELGLSKTNLRDHQSTLALYYTAIAEEVCKKILNELEELNFYIARSCIQEYASIIGHQADETSRILGIDIATDTPLDESLKYPRLDEVRKMFPPRNNSTLD